MQLEVLREYAARRELEVVGEFVDHGVSGARDHRPELDRLMSSALQRAFDVVLVYRFDRFARSVRHLVTALDEFRALGVEFISYSESLDTSTPMGARHVRDRRRTRGARTRHHHRALRRRAASSSRTRRARRSTSARCRRSSRRQATRRRNERARRRPSTRRLACRRRASASRTRGLKPSAFRPPLDRPRDRDPWGVGSRHLREGFSATHPIAASPQRTLPEGTRPSGSALPFVALWTKSTLPTSPR